MKSFETTYMPAELTTWIDTVWKIHQKCIIRSMLTSAVLILIWYVGLMFVETPEMSILGEISGIFCMVMCIVITVAYFIRAWNKVEEFKMSYQDFYVVDTDTFNIHPVKVSENHGDALVVKDSNNLDHEWLVRLDTGYPVIFSTKEEAEGVVSVLL